MAMRRESAGRTVGKAMTTGGNKDTDTMTPAALLTISDEHRNELRAAFDMFDTAGTGRIKAHEVKVALYALGYDVSNDELAELLREIGAELHGTMDFHEFYSVLLRKMTQKESRLESMRAFKQMDVAEKGFISLDDLRAVARSLQVELTDDELLEMIQFAHPTAASTTGGGGGSGGTGAGSADGASTEFDAREMLAVSEEEFLALMKRAHVY